MPTTRTRGAAKTKEEEDINDAKRIKLEDQQQETAVAESPLVPVPPLPEATAPSVEQQVIVPNEDHNSTDPAPPVAEQKQPKELTTAVPTPLDIATTTTTEQEQETTSPEKPIMEEQQQQSHLNEITTPATVAADDASKTAAAIASVGGPLDEKHQAEINAALEKVKEEALRNTPSISTIVTEGLWDDDPKKVEESLTELANLSFGHANAGPNRVTISLTGGLLAIVKALTKHADDPEVQAAGGRALQNLALDQNNKGGIASAGGIEVLVSAMKKFPDDPAVQMGGCGTFQNLVWGNDENRTRILKAGAIPEIIVAMNNHTEFPELQEWACGALYLLSVGEAEVKEAILESRGLSAIAKAIEDNKEDGGIREKGRNAMARLLWP